MTSASLSKNKLSLFRKFLQKKTREAEGRFLIEGWHLLDEALKADKAIHVLIFDPERRRDPGEAGILERALKEAGESYLAAAVQIGQLTDARSSQGVVALIDRVGQSFDAVWATLRGREQLRVMALDALADPGNCGTIIRSCDWFGIDAVLMGRGCAELENGKVARATMGGLFHLPIAVEVDLPAALRTLKAQGLKVFSAELEGAKPMDELPLPPRAALVVGNEARGVSSGVSTLSEERIGIARHGKGESLNAAMAASILLAHWRSPAR